MLSGQVFRWRKTSTGLAGVDGDCVWIAEPLGDGAWSVEGSRDEEAWLSFFRMEVDVASLCEQLKAAGPELAPALAAVPGLRILRPISRWEAFLAFLCSPNNNLARIMSMAESLGRLGPLLGEVEGRPIHAFPSPGTVAEADPARLRSLGFGYRAPRIVEAAAHVRDRGGENWLDGLAAGSYEGAWEALCEISGIGPKLADCICLFALDKLEAVPVDTHVWNAACDLYFPEWKGKAVTAQRYQAVGSHFRSRFGAASAWAHQFLFTQRMAARRRPPAP